MVLVGTASGKITMALNMMSIKLVGHRFTTRLFLELTILYVGPSSKLIPAEVLQGSTPWTGPKTMNFQVENNTIMSVTSNYYS